MITGQLKSQIDSLWLEFHTGGITNPLTVIEQISFLMFMRMMDITETREERKAARQKTEFKGTFSPEQQNLRWSNFKNLSGEEMLPLVRDKVFSSLRKKLSGETENEAESNEGISDAVMPEMNQLTKKGGFTTFFQDASFLIQKPSLLVSAVQMIDNLPLTEGDTKGDLYEYLLSKLTTAGINGQFRTPRHIIRLMVEMLAPRPDERIADPSCGTAGFLVETMLYLLRAYTSPEGIHTEEDGEKIYTGDLLEPYREHIQNDFLYGFDFDVTMLRIAAMNLLLHGIEQPNILYADTLGKKFGDDREAKSRESFDVILANPPFTGSLDASDVHLSLYAEVKTKKTELLFLALILRMLRQGGRSATIVPDGVLFSSTKAHLDIRRKLVETNQLEGIISLPSGVFKPYAGVSTGILIFTKGGTTKDVFFYDVKADGFSLDDKRIELNQEKHETNNLPDILARWRERENQTNNPRTAQAFVVPKSEIVENNYDLSINRYKETVYEAIQYAPPKTILSELKDLEIEIQNDLQELEAMLA
jgi:type I restriction enzyme M protein